MAGYVTRMIDPLVEAHLEELPAVMLIGPRACGKTTSAARLANTVVRLDSDDAAAFRASPDAALRGRDEPVLIDEWQMVPEVLGAVKRAVDGDRRPGRFLITGSARRDPADRFWPGTGRIVMVKMCPLTIAEQRQLPVVPLVDRLAAGGEPPVAAGPVPDLRDYLQLALRGGFPEPALELSERAARVWLESYADQIALRDARSHGDSPDAGRLQRYLEARALNSAGTAHHKTVYDAAGVSRKTALAYDALLEDLLVVHELPAWSTNRLRRLSRAPKRYVVDSGLLSGILRVGIGDVLGDSDLLGRMVETFVVAQLSAQAAIAETRYRLSHLREQDGRRQVDVIAELAGGRIIGIEVKAKAAVARSDARHLIWLRDEMPDRFTVGVVLHSGRDVFELDERVLAAPLSALWASSERRHSSSDSTPR